MKSIILVVALAALAQGGPLEAVEPCQSVPLAEPEVLVREVPSPYQLAIDRDTNTLFFSFTSPHAHSTFESVFVDLKDKTSGTIPGVSGGFAQAYDQQNKIVYIGGADGIYKYNYATKRADKMHITDDSIWQLFAKDGALYYTTYPDEKAYVYKNGVARLVPELMDRRAMLIAYDKNEVVYSQGGELKKMVRGKVVEFGDYAVNAFNTDVNGNLYFSTSQAIYKFVGGAIEKVGSFDNLYGFAIERDGAVIAALENSVLRVRTPAAPCAARAARDDADGDDTDFSYSVQ